MSPKVNTAVKVGEHKAAIIYVRCCHALDKLVWTGSSQQVEVVCGTSGTQGYRRPANTTSVCIMRCCAALPLQAILNSLLEQTGTLSLEHLRSLPCDDVRAQLSQFKGVGPKTIACVQLFCLGRAEFPVDTHVWEISKQLGWVPGNATREQTYEHLNVRVPDEIK